MSHTDGKPLEKAGADPGAALSRYTIVHDIADGSAQGKRHYDIQLLPLGERMGLTSADVAEQVRYAFQGTKALQQQRGINEVTVRVNLPESERATESTLENMVLQSEYRVVVNESLVLIDFANRRASEGASRLEAIHSASIQRFRPILLTTITTFGGLIPMITETSSQARMMVPMAISLGFGVLFSTAVIMVIVPSLYLVLDDFSRLIYRPAKNEGAVAVLVRVDSPI